MGKHTIKEMLPIGVSPSYSWYMLIEDAEWTENTRLTLTKRLSNKTIRLKNLILADYISRTENINNIEFDGEKVRVHINEPRTVFEHIAIATDLINNLEENME